MGEKINLKCSFQGNLKLKFLNYLCLGNDFLKEDHLSEIQYRDNTSMSLFGRVLERKTVINYK